MNYHEYEYEMLARFKRQEIEKAANEAWKYNSVQQESIFQKLINKLSGRLEKENSKTEQCCCCCVAS